MIDERRTDERRTDDLRPCRDGDREAILTLVNAAAEAYRGVIPADRWHEPTCRPRSSNMRWRPA